MPNSLKKIGLSLSHGEPPPPGDISFVGSGTPVPRNVAGPTDFFAVPLYITPIDGDFQLLVCYTMASGVSGSFEQPEDAGWSIVLDGQGSGGSLFIAYKFYETGDDDPQLTLDPISSGQSHIAQIFTFRDVDQANPVGVLGTLTHNASQQNIGPIGGITPLTDEATVIVIGGKADDWTSVATLTGDGLTWVEITDVSTALGTDAGLVVDYAHDWQSGAISDKTFTVTGGATDVGTGIMLSIRPSGVATLTYDLTIVHAGTGTGTTDPAEGTYTFPAYDVIDLSASPAGGSVFAGWSGGITDSSQLSQVTMDNDLTVTATFNTGTGESNEIAGTGAVLKEDLVTINNPTVDALWESRMSPFGTGAWSTEDTTITRITPNPDTHVPVGQGAPTTHFRRLKRLEAYLTSSVSGTPTTVQVDDASEFPASCRGAGQNEGLATINGTRAFTYSSRTDTTLNGCANWVGTPTTYVEDTAVRIQSVFDAGVPNSRTRTQLLRHSTIPGTCFYQLTSGNDYVIYTCFRFMHPSPLIGQSQTTGRDMVWQLKEYPNPGAPNPIFSFTEAEGTFRMVRMGTVELDINIDKSVGFILFAFALRTSPNTGVGKMRVYADLDGGGDLLPLHPTITNRTMVSGTAFLIPSVGSYANMGVPAVHRDMSYFQICDYDGSGF